MPVIITGAKALVIMASGKLNNVPRITPFFQDEMFKFVSGIKNPMAKRPKKAPNIAIFLSGSGIGNIKTTSKIPKISPKITPL